MNVYNLQRDKSASRFALLLSASTITMMPAYVLAQEASGDQSAGVIEDIVVTAQRRAEPAQSVPISLQSFSAESLQNTVVRDTEGLTAVVGALIIQPTSARPAIFVRGVGTNSTSTTPAVLTFIDGVYQPFGRSTDLANIASVEVLKGPQGTLFGRNATGGVIQITTEPPSETVGGRAEVGYGNYDTVDASTYMTGGLARGVAMDLSMSYSDQNEGFGTNVFNGEDVFLTRKFSTRSRLRWEVSDDSTLTLSGDFSEIRGTVGTNVSPAVGYDFLFGGGQIRRRGEGQFYPGDFDVNAGPISPYYKGKEWGTSLTFETNFSEMTFRNVTAYRRGEEHFRIDFDGGPADVVNLRNDRSPQEAFTQELQLLSNGAGPFQWVTGVFYFKATNAVSPFQIAVNAAFSEDSDESIAPYAQGTYEILPDTRLTLGGRYTVETRKINGFVLVNGVEANGRRGSLSQEFKEPTWRVALDHAFTDDVLVYGSVSRGFNAGFYNQTNVAGFGNEMQNPPVKPEFLTSYELGAKTDLLDRRLRFNISAFLYDYDGLQQQIFDQGAVKTINAGAAEIRGIDVELTTRPISSLTLSLSGTYLDTEYKSYRLAPNYVLQPNGSVIAVGNIDAAGKHITNAPDLSATASATHELPTAIGTFTTSMNLNYRGKTFVDPVNSFELPTRYLLNASERWTSSDGRYFATLWVKNLLDERYDYAINILTPTGLIGQTAPPRTYGISAGVEF